MVTKDAEPKKQGSTQETPTTPLMKQYSEIKNQYRGIILFFRLGDFYEMFGEDAVKASKILQVVLTQRQGVPMCGIPHHAINSYLNKLVKAGERVAICEQLEEAGVGKGIVKRGVVRVITPGTILEDTLLEAKQNNFLLSIYPDKDFLQFGIAFVDISTGEFGCTEISRKKLSQEVFKLSPGEIILPESARETSSILKILNNTASCFIKDYLFSPIESDSRIKNYFKTQSVKPFGLENRPLAMGAAGGILAYLEENQINRQLTFSHIRYYSTEDYLMLDEIAIKNLELVEGLNTHSKEDSLLEILDLTLTPMGGRLLNRWLMQPLLSVSAIKLRQNAVGFFVEEGIERRVIRSLLGKICDLERILSRIASQTAGPRELVSLKNSLSLLPEIKENMRSHDCINGPPQSLKVLNENLVAPEDALKLISSAILDEPAPNLKDGGVIRPGFSDELDEYRKLSREAKTIISEMEAIERQNTGIGSLKIGYTSVFGYYIEVTRSNIASVPHNYIRKQTLANAERFITPELKSFEEKVLSAEEKLVRLEDKLFRDVREKLLDFADSIKKISCALAEIDIYLSFAENAVFRNYCCPTITDGFELEISDGRHPVIENKIKSGSFVSNDVFLDGDDNQIILLTGPNMAGKSTYLRQTALIVVMAQIGSYVPASSAVLGIVDRVFTRIGAADNLSGGESTFMVEMHETANILNQNTSRSLIILDEVGRGTSTYDGISIAWATLEFLSTIKLKNSIGPKVLFATHYFELTDLAAKLKGVNNYNVSVKEWQGDVLFLHKIVPGAADRSYGIHVAQIAGLPKEVINRAYAILSTLENKTSGESQNNRINQPELFLDSFENISNNYSFSENILIELKAVETDKLTPLEALQKIAKWKKEIKDKIIENNC